MKKKIKRAVATGMSLAMGTVIMTSDVMVSPVMASQVSGDNSYAVELYASSDASYNGLYYSTSGSYATITGYDGESTDIVIPEKIGSYTVNAIQYGAFSNNNKITSVKIPASVTKIGGSYKMCIRDRFISVFFRQSLKILSIYLLCDVKYTFHIFIIKLITPGIKYLYKIYLVVRE